MNQQEGDVSPSPNPSGALDYLDYIIGKVIHEEPTWEVIGHLRYLRKVLARTLT